MNMKKKLLLGFLTVIAVALAAMTCLLFTGCGDVSDLTTLSDPQVTGYDPESGKISWKFVDNADSYEVTLSDGVESKTSEVKTGSIVYKTTADSFEFSIKAKNNGLFKDSNTVSYTFVRLAGEVTLTADEDGTVSWEAVDGATGYEVVVDNVTVATVVDTSYSEVEAGKVHAVRVRPAKANTENTMYFSSWSKPISINKLKEVPAASITYKDGSIVWSAVASAASYTVTINNTEHEVTENKLAYDAGGESFAVTVKAIGNHTSTYNSTVSKEKSFVYLAQVTGVRVENGALTWDPVEGATGYQVKLNGVNSTASNVNEPKLPNLSANHQYSVTVIPTAKADDTVYFSDWSALASIYILPAPVLEWAGLDVDGVDEVRAIKWNMVDGAGGYSAKVTTPDGVTKDETLPALNNFYSSNFNASGTYTIEVKATSDSTDKYESAYSKAMTVTRLEAPVVTSNNVSSTADDVSKGFTVSFSPVSGASGYALYKDDVKDLTSTTPGFKVNNLVEADNTREIQIAYYVQSQGKVSGNNITLNSLSSVAQSSVSSAFTVKVLATPTDPTIEGTTYSYTGSTAESGYSVNVSGKGYTATGTTFELNSILNAAGTYPVKVCAMGNGHEVLASTFSTAINVTRLVAPYNLKIATGESDGVMSFEGDSNALSYTASIIGGEQALTVDTTTNIRPYINTEATHMNLFSEANYFKDEQHTVYYMRSLASTTFTFYKLATPDNVTFSNTHMTWNAPSNHPSTASFIPPYKIFDKSTEEEYNGSFTGTSYSLATLEGGKAYSFGIVAIGDGTSCINSEPAFSKEVIKLKTPTLTVNTTDFQYEWNAVANASDYVLTIDGKIVDTDIHTSGTTYTYKPTYTTLTDKKVVLYALGDNGETTVNSSNCEYTQKVKQLSTPEFKYSYGADSFDPTADITVEVTTETNCPNGYYYVIGSASHLEASTSYSFNTNTSGAIKISVYAKGGGFDDQEVYYTDSRSAPEVTLNLLGYPTEKNITVNKDGTIRWDQVTGASGYLFKIDIVGTDGVNYTYSGTIGKNEATLALDEFTADDGTKLTYAKVRTMTLELQAKGTLSANSLTGSNGSVTSQKVTKAWTSNLH